jgi:hypothetical protein
MATKQSRAFEANGLKHLEWPHELRAKPEYTVNLVAVRLDQLADDLRAFSLGTLKQDAAKLAAAYAAADPKHAILAKKITSNPRLTKHAAALFLVHHLVTWTKTTQKIAECMPKESQQPRVTEPLNIVRGKLSEVKWQFETNPHEVSRGQLCKNAGLVIDEAARAWASDIEAAAVALGGPPNAPVQSQATTDGASQQWFVSRGNGIYVFPDGTERLVTYAQNRVLSVHLRQRIVTGEQLRTMAKIGDPIGVLKRLAREISPSNAIDLPSPDRPTGYRIFVRAEEIQSARTP